MKRRASKGTDPLLQSPYWINVVRPFWKDPRNQRPCARCRGYIDYAAPRFYPGTRKVNPRSLAVGHIIERHKARAMGWSDDQINDISNTQPECARCSDSSGAKYGNALRGLRVVRTRPSLDGSREW
jgi:hypothetical protein